MKQLKTKNNTNQLEKARRQLYQNQVKIESIFSAAPVGIGLVLNRVIIEANEKLCKMTGYSKEELTNRNARILYPSEQEFLRAGKEYLEQIEKYGTGSVETKWKTKDDKIIDVLLNATPLDINDPSISCTFTALDITQRKNALFSLRLSEQRFRTIANYTYNWENWISNTGMLLWLNPGAERVTGYTVNECMKMRDFPAPLLHKEDVEMVLTAIKMSIKGSICDGLEFRITTKDGIEKWVEMCSQPACDENGNSQGVRLSIRDITLRKNIDLALHSFLKFTSTKFGKQFFDSLVTQLAKHLKADVALIGQLSRTERDTVETVSVIMDGNISENFSYSLKGTPCENIIGKIICCYKSNAGKLFPKDHILKDLNIQAYIGVPLFNSFGAPLGLIAVLYREPLKQTHFAEDILRIFASRTAAEIERDEYEKAFIYRLNFEDLLSEISMSFINIKPEDIDISIERALEKIAEFANVDLGYVFQFTDESKYFSMTHFWHNENVTTKKINLQNLETYTMPWWMSRLLSSQPVIVPSVKDLPKIASIEQSIIEAQNIKSVVDFPLSCQNRVFGFMGFSSITQNRYWTEDDLVLLKMAGQIITNALLRKQDLD